MKIKALPIFPPVHRANDHFPVGEKIILISLVGNIKKIEVISISKNSINYLHDGKIMPHAVRSPLIISLAEYLWLKKLLTPYSNQEYDDVYKNLIQASRNGYEGAIIFLNHLALIEKIHGANAMYTADFPKKIIAAILKT